MELLRPNSERMHTGQRAGTWKSHDPEPGENYPRLSVLVSGRRAMGHTGWSRQQDSFLDLSIIGSMTPFWA